MGVCAEVLLKKFSVSNFKNFHKEFVMDFSNVHEYDFNSQCLKDGFVKNAIIYGENAVGKTNFGLALFDITYHLVDKMRNINSLASYINADSEINRADFCYEFQDAARSLVYTYSKSEGGQLQRESLMVNDDLVFDFDFSTGQGDFSKLKKFDLDTLNWEFRDNGISILRYMANNLTLSKEHPVMRIMKFVSGMLWFCSMGNGNSYVGLTSKNELITDFIIREGYVSDFEKFLNKYGVKEKILAARNPDGTQSLYFAHKRLVPFALASSGTNALMNFYYWYKQLDNVTFLYIDEFDAFYHFELAEKVVELLRDCIHVQSVLTSHNTALMANRFMRPDCYFILTRDRLVSLADATPRELHQGHNLEKLYMSGEFDG